MRKYYHNDFVKINNKKKIILECILINQFGGKSKWKTLVHNGVLFPPEYKPHNKPLKCNIDDSIEYVNLSENAEEAAMMYAKYITTDYINNKTFNKNFWNDWKKMLGENSKIKSLEQCDFTEYNQILVNEKEQRKTKGVENEVEIEKFKTAIVDDKIQPVGNFRIEPPGIFIGRGDNPKIGKIKRRIYPEDIIINVSKGVEVPVPEFLKEKGHKWKKIIHDHSVEWLASWKDDITNKTKYVLLGSHSDIKASSDQQKFDLARKLKKKIKLIEEKNEKNLLSNDKKTRETAVALYFIDKLALRVGNEKGSDETDTVGVTSLRVEHIKLMENNKITLDFLGKDSVRYYNTITIDPLVYTNLEEFIKNKSKGDKLFDLINSNDVNKYLQTFMKNLTAKVFRTYNASKTFQKELRKINKKYENIEENNKNKTMIMDEYSKANAKVAILCNHQKNIGKSFKNQLEKINQKIKKTKAELKKAIKSKTKNSDKITRLKNKLTILKSKKELKCQLKNISLGTSKANYIDPRITVAFMKLHNLPLDKIFSKALQQKFEWAFNVDKDFKF
jgi:DNA topoisomerase-1